MREAPGLRRSRILLLVIFAYALAGCLAPPREAVKGSGWTATSPVNSQTEEAVKGQTLIKPTIPADENDPAQARSAESQSGPQITMTADAQKGNDPLRMATSEGITDAAVQPPPRPVRWQAPPDNSSSDNNAPSYVQPTPQDRTAYLPVPDTVSQQTLKEDPTLPVRSSQPSPVPQVSEVQTGVQPVPPGQVPPTVSRPESPQPPAGKVDVSAPQAGEVTQTASPKPTSVNSPPTVKPQVAAAQGSAEEAKAGSREWEDQRIKKMALKLAAELPGVKKGKICYSVNQDEWWIVLYEEAGTAYDVKQYVWNRDQDKLEPFLALKRISKNRLTEHLTSREADKVCEPLDLDAREP